jgi:hypothetical protein
VLDVPAIKRAAPGETVQVPILISHFSGRLREKPFTLLYRLDYIDALGNRRRGKAQRQVVVGVPDYRLTPLTVAQVQLPNEPCLATLVVWAEDWNRARIHTNYTQWLVGMEQLPAFEAQRGRVILRFKPDCVHRRARSTCRASPTARWRASTGHAGTATWNTPSPSPKASR